MEARDVPIDAADVVVADGFTGNMFLKTYEGVAILLLGKLKEIFTKSALNKMAAAILLKDIKALMKTMDYNEYGGAPLMGCAKPVFKAHGSAKAKTFYNALRLTKAYVDGDVVSEIAGSVASYRESHGQESAEDDE